MEKSNSVMSIALLVIALALGTLTVKQCFFSNNAPNFSEKLEGKVIKDGFSPIYDGKCSCMLYEDGDYRYTYDRNEIMVDGEYLVNVIEGMKITYNNEEESSNEGTITSIYKILEVTKKGIIVSNTVNNVTEYWEFQN